VLNNNHLRPVFLLLQAKIFENRSVFYGVIRKIKVMAFLET